MKKYVLELDAFEAGCIAGVLMAAAANDRASGRSELSDGVLVHLRHRIGELAKKIYVDDRAEQGNA